MSVRLRSRSLVREAEEVASAHYEALKGEVLQSVAGGLRSHGIVSMMYQDLEVAYNEAWQGVTQHIVQGRPVTSLGGLLYTVTLRRAIDLYRGKQERRRVDMDLDLQGVAGDLAEGSDTRQLLGRVFERAKELLNEKERRAVTLCLLHGYKRSEAAALLGVDRAVFERVMDGAMHKMAGIVAGVQARGCGDDEWSRMMRAYALGLLAEDERDYRRAHEHVEGPEACEACRRYVRGLRGLAAVLPPLLPPGLLDDHDASGLLVRLAEWLGGGGHTAGSASALQGAAAAGGSASVVGAAAGRGTSGKLVIAAIAALSLAGGAVVIATHRAVAHAHHHSAAPPPVRRLVSPSISSAGNDDAFSWPRGRRGSARAVRHRSVVRLAARSRVHRRRRVAAPEAPPEFSFETPAAEPTPARAPDNSARQVPRRSAPRSGGESEGSEFGFEP